MGRRARKQAPEGQRWCPRGTHFVPIGEFAPSKTAKDGLRGYCRTCERSWEAQKRPAKGDSAPIDTKKPDPLPKQLAPGSDWSEERVSMLCTMLERGHTRKVAAAWAGLSLAALRGLLERGAELESGPERVIHDRLVAAEARAEAKLAESTFNAASVDSRGAFKVLERRFRADWARETSSEEADPAAKEEQAAEVRNKLLEKFTRLLAGSTVKETSEKPAETPAEAAPERPTLN